MQFLSGELIFILKPRAGYYVEKLLMMNDEDDDNDDHDENSLVNSIQTVSTHVSAGAARTTLIFLIEDENIPFNKMSRWKRGIVGNV